MHLQITTEFILILFGGFALLGLIYILHFLTKDIPKRVYILVPIPLYLFLLFLIAATYFLVR
jgi:hypothetical protein